MSSDHNPVRTSGDSSSSAADDAAPCTSSLCSGSRKVKLVCAYGGKILPRPIDGVLRYAGGESRIINLRRDTSLPEFFSKMAETYGGPVAVRYQLPDEDLDSLISVSTPEDLENMMDEVDEIAEDNPSAKLRVFLFSPAEVVGLSMDQHYSGKDRQDQDTMYIEAINGLDNRVLRKDGMASVSSMQNSDGANGAAAAADSSDEGTSSAFLIMPTDTNAHDPYMPIIAVQNMHDLPTAISSVDQNNVFNSTQSGLPPSVTYLQESYVNPHHSQFMNGQPFIVADLHQQVNVALLPLAHGKLPPISQPGNEMPIQKREDPVLEEKTSIGKYTNVPSDPTFQPQLPPLPPAHLLVPKGQTLRLEECSLHQKNLPHSHLDTAINDQATGTVSAKPVLQSHHTDGVEGMKAPHVDVNGSLTDDVANLQHRNLVSATPLVSYEMSCNIERPNVLVTSNIVQTKTLGQGLAASMVPSIAVHDTVTDLKTSQQGAPLVLGRNCENNGHSIFKNQPNPSLWPDDMSNEPPKFCWEGQLQFGQNLIALNQEPINQQLIAEISSVRNPNLHEGVLAQFSSYNKLDEGMIKSLYVSPYEPSALSDQTNQAVLTKMAVSKDSRPDVLPSLIKNSIAAKPLDESNAIPLNDLVLTIGVVPNGITCLPEGPLGTTDQEFIYIQNSQAAKANHTLYTTGNNPLIDIEMSDYTYNILMNKHPTEEKKDDASKFQAKEVSVDIMNTEPLQGQVSSNSLFFNDNPQKILWSAPVLSHINVSDKESIDLNEPLSNIQSPDTKVSTATVLEGVLAYSSQSSKDLGTDDILSFKDYEHIEQVMSASAEERLTPLLYLSNVPDHSNNEERGTKENDVERADDKAETIKDGKQPSKLMNGFPSTVDMGHLQVIKNSDLEEIRELGSGTFGTVYHGKWRGSDVAIKRLNEPIFSGKPSDQERAKADFWNEACKLSTLHHPNVMTLYGIVSDGPGGTIATVTEFMVNGSLRNALVKSDKTFDWRKQLIIAMDVAFGMEYLHSRNIIHFDLKSDNLLVNLRDPQRPICKVGDLGLSKVKFETLMSGGMRGTLPWMAPELLDGKTKCTEKIDVYSFGIVMWELLTGDEPYADLHYGAIIGGIIKKTLRPPVPESCDAQWRSLMEQCWSVEPTERPSFTEISSRLRSMGASIHQRG